MTIERASDRGTIYRARAEQVYPGIADGSVSLVISDGPYFLKKAAWDRFTSWDAFRDWYRPHVEAWGRVCAPSATTYLWGTDDSASELRPLMREHGWTKRVRVTWDKVRSYSQVGYRRAKSWPDVTEVCDVWARGDAEWAGTPGELSNVWRYAPDTYRKEILWSGETHQRVKHQPPRSLPLHPCQKPLAFYDRIIRASSRPGSLVLEPFAGTCRAAVACEAMPADEARRYICIEPDEDGRDYLAAVVASLTDEPMKLVASKPKRAAARATDRPAPVERQVSLFGGTP